MSSNVRRLAEIHDLDHAVFHTHAATALGRAYRESVERLGFT